jgi:hypothetical protein
MNFISEINSAYLILFCLLAFGLTWYFYFYKNKWNDLPKKVKICLYVLRFLTIYIVLILLLGIFLEIKTNKDEKPILISLIDNSTSILNYKDSSNVRKEIPNFITQIKSLNSKFEHRFYLIGDQNRNSEKVNFLDKKTNLSQPFEELFTDYYNRNIGAIILISDGNYNEGNHPIYAASKIPFTPILTVAIGDTTIKSDQVLKDVIHNEIGFLNNKIPIQVNIEAFKLKEKNSKVNLFQNGKLIASKSITYSNLKENFQQINFEVEAKSIGFQNFKIEIEGMKSEYTLKNNFKQFYIEILDARNKILLLSGAPHPDISALKSVFEQDKNIEVQFSNIENWDKNLKNTDLIIWHEPGINFNDEVNQVIQKSGISLLYFIGSATNASTIKKLNIGLEQNQTNQTDEVQVSFAKGFELFEIDEKIINEIEKYPPLIVKFGTPKISNQNKILLKQRISSIEKKEAVMYFGSNELSKYGVFLGEGIWRWKFSNYQKAKNHDIFNEFITKINNYLVQKKNTSNLRVTLPKKFNTIDEVLIKAEFYNEAMELITKPKIAFQLIDDKGNKSILEFGANNQSYLLQLGKLKPGHYTWSAKTNYSGKNYTKTGSFIVESDQIEKLDTKANHEILNQLSSNSKGKMYQLADISKLINDIEKRDDIVTVSYKQNEVVPIVDLIWILILLLLLLSLEWFLKRWYGYY